MITEIKLRKLVLFFLLVPYVSCSDFVEIDPPRTDLIKSTVFTNDKTAIAAVSDIYAELADRGFASGDFGSITYLASLSSDELLNYNDGPGLGQTFKQFNENTLNSTNGSIASLWSELYRTIYKANAIVEGLASSSGISQSLSDQLEGEAKFLRAFCHFYLVALWGDIPLVLSTDYRINAGIPRMPKEEVYEQVILDLTLALGLLSEEYSFSGGQRVRPNQAAAAALLSRTYLYNGEWAAAERLATSIIDNSAAYTLEPYLDDVFDSNNREAIWQFASNRPTNDAMSFLLAQSPGNGALRPEFLEAFEAGDKRASSWIGSVTDGPNTYYYPTKYKAIDYGNITEYSTVFRLAEQYLIRAEARAHQNNITAAQEDVNAIRLRAGLESTPASDQSSLLEAIHQERKVELFTEWGHRWLDLKRTNTADPVLSPLKMLWRSTASLYPIPEVQILNDISMRYAQNPGY